MAHATYLREKARQMRRDRGMTIDELSDRLGLSRSTIYHWVRDLPVERKDFNSTPLARARGVAAHANRTKHARLRAEAYERGRAEFADLAKEPTFTDFVCMYIGEGYKRSRHTVSICNSDPAVVKLGDHWIRRFGKNPVRYSVQYHADQDLAELQAHWAALFGIVPDEIKMKRKSNSNGLTGRTWRCKWGVLDVACHDTLFRARLGGWMDELRSSWP